MAKTHYATAPLAFVIGEKRKALVQQIGSGKVQSYLSNAKKAMTYFGFFFGQFNC